MRATLLTMSLAVYLAVSGCATYKAVSLPRLVPEFAPYSEKQDGLILACKAFTQADCKKYLGRDVMSKGYQPIQISIRNETKRFFLFSHQGISLPCVPPEEVASLVHTNTTGRAAGYGVAGLFIWPLLVPAVVDGVGSSQANQRLDTDYAAKELSERVIQPFATIDGLVFVPMSSYSNSFSITIVDKETKEGITFTPKLNGTYTNEPRYEKVSWPQSWFR